MASCAKRGRGFQVRLNRSEALDIFRKWFSERVLLECRFRFPDFEACFRGRLFGVSEDQIKVASDDTTSELTLALRPSMTFAYGDPRDFPADAKQYISILVVFFEEPSEEESLDKRVSFVEFK
jgi:hypothetical protein